MRRVIFAPLGVIAFALAGCAAKPTPPVIETRIEREYLPVAVACVDAKDVPIEPVYVGGLLNGKADHDIGPIAASNLRLRAAFDRALALLSACAATPRKE